MKIDLFAPESIFSVKNHKKDRSESNLFVRRGQSTLKSVDQLLFAPLEGGKRELTSRFCGSWAKKKNGKPLWGAGIILRPRREKKKKEIPEPSHTLEGTNDSGVLLSGFFLAKK